MDQLVLPAEWPTPLPLPLVLPQEGQHYYPLQQRLQYHDAPLELVAIFYELLSPDTDQQEFWGYRTALHRTRERLMRELSTTRRINR
jgi:hypothetical protein